MKSLSFIFYLLLLYGMALSQIREYIYVSQKMNWIAAQTYCRQQYGDLASITTEEENQRAANVTGLNEFEAFIGLNRTAPHANIWQWSAGERPYFTKWHLGEPNDITGESCTLFTTNGWYDVTCDVNHPVLCQRSEIREYIYVSQKMNWTTAQTYCRQHYDDFASITTEEESQRAEMIAGPNVTHWIGLNRTAPNVNIWQWSAGEEFSYTNWFPGEPNDCNGKESCTATFQNCWNDMDCKTYFPFMCQRRFILVEEKKTWDEALQHCRNHNSNLTVMRFETLADPLKIKTEQAQTASMWTGLRF
ncbi:hypothetical protein C0J50_7876, partial [Silurus asotus]